MADLNVCHFLQLLQVVELTFNLVFDRLSGFDTRYLDLIFGRIILDPATVS